MGKKIIFLGSSVTYGSAAGGVSFAYNSSFIKQKSGVFDPTFKTIFYERIRFV